MEIKIGTARVSKSGMNCSGDSLEIVERPLGGLAAILADGQGSGLTAYRASGWTVRQAAALLAAGTRDSAIAKAVHDELYETQGHRTACALTILSADAEAEMISISRNSHCPVIVKTEEYLTVYDEDAQPIGVQKHTKPETYDLPFAPGLVLVTFTSGVQLAGKKHGGHGLDLEKIQPIIEANGAEECDFIARSILDYALSLDHEAASDDMTVLVMGISERSVAPEIEERSISYPF